MNQGKLETVKQEMDHLSIIVLDVSKQEWSEIGHVQSSNFKLFYSGSDKFRRNIVVLTLRKDVARQLGATMQGWTNEYQ